MADGIDICNSGTRATFSAMIAGSVGRNTVTLYLRMLLLLVADIFAVRFSLKALGVSAYGCFSTIAVVVSTMRFLNGKLEETALRFQSADPRGSKALASVGILTLFLCLAMVVLGETFFRWYGETQIDLSGMALTFHLGVAVAVLKTMRIPLVTQLIARSRRWALAGLSVVEASLALGASVLVSASSLRTVNGYAVLLFGSEILTTLAAAVLCRRELQTVRAELQDLSQLRVQGTFFGWSSLTAIANALKYQGVCVLLTRWAGLAYAATWRATMNFGFCLYGVIGFFQQSYLIVLVRLWTAGNREKFKRVLFVACGLSMLLMALFAVPILVFADWLVPWWLDTTTPPESVAFLRCVAAHFLIESLAAPLHAAIAATGRIARYQIAVSLTMGSGFLLAGVALVCGLPAWSAMAAVAVSNALSVLYRVIYVRRFILFR